MDWRKEVKEYLENYEEDNIDAMTEYIDSCVPHYYYDIIREAEKLEGEDSIIYSRTIESNHVGKSVYNILQEFIFEAMFEKFEEARLEYLQELEEE